MFLAGRAWFYINGDCADVVEVGKEAVRSVAVASTTTAGVVATTAAGVVKEL